MRGLAAALLLVPVVAVGCGGPENGYAVDLTIIADGSLSDRAIASIRSVQVDVAGAERATTTASLTSPFADRRQERVIYRPRVTDGQLEFTITARDQTGAAVADGANSIALRSGATLPLTVTLFAAAPLVDGGALDAPLGDGAPPDLAPADLATFDHAVRAPDLATLDGSGEDALASDLAEDDLAVPDLAGGDLATLATDLAGADLATQAIDFASADFATPAIDLASADLARPDGGGPCFPGSDGMVCAPTANPCDRPGLCSGGVCSPITHQPNGTLCAKPINACRTARLCSAGLCGPEGVRPNGYNFAPGYLNRCCNGTPSQINSDVNCGACGLACGNGESCTNLDATNAMQWWCRCKTNVGCWSKCCASGNVCAPSNCASPLASCIPCPGDAVCTMALPHFYCHY